MRATLGDLTGGLLTRVTELETATRQVLATATAELDGLRQKAEAAGILAGAARELLPRTGDGQAALETRLDQATRRLQRERPGWWPADGAALTTAEQIEGAANMLADGPRRVWAAVRGVRQAVADILGAANKAAREQARVITDLGEIALDLLAYTGGQRDSLTRDLEDAAVRADRSAMERLPEATLAGVAAAVRDFDRITAFEANVRHVITQATAGLAERLNAAPALAPAARALLPQARARRAALDAALTEAEQAVRDLPRPHPAGRAAAQPAAGPGIAGLIRPHPRLAPPARRPVPSAGSPLDRARDAGYAWRAVTRLEAAARDVLDEVITGLGQRWPRVDDARDRAAAARALLAHDGPGQAELTGRLDAAIGRLYEIGPARLTPPGVEPVTAAQLEAARQALAGPAQAIEAAAETLDQVAADVLATAPARWDEHLAQATRLETYAAGLLDRLGDQAGGVLSALRELDAARSALRRVPEPNALTADIAAAASALNALVDATERLDAAVRATAPGRADALLGERHGLDLARATAVMALADRLSGGYPPGLTDAERFARLAEQAGVRHREDAIAANLGSRDQRPVTARLVGLLELATQVFGDRPAGLDELIDLRLAGRYRPDRAGRRGRRPRPYVRLADLEGEFRRATISPPLPP